MINIDELLNEYLDLENYFIDKCESKERVDKRHKYVSLLLKTLDELEIIREDLEQNFNKEFLCPYKTNREDYIILNKYFNNKLNKCLALQDKIIKLIRDERFRNCRLRNRFFYEDILFEILCMINNIRDNIEKNNKSDYVCPFGNIGNDNDYINMMIAPNSIKGKNKLNEFIKNAKQLIIIDPFIYTEKVNEFFVGSNHNLKSLVDVKVIYDKKKEGYSDTNKSVFEAGIINSIKPNKCKVQSFDSELIHDRLWIKDKKEGLVLGTSLKSIKGKRASFILDLPGEDLTDILEFLKKDCKIFV